MRYERIRSIRPLTKLMVKLLQDCYHREKHCLEAISIYDPEMIKGLIERGLIENTAKKGKAEKYTITELGKEYIIHYFGE